MPACDATVTILPPFPPAHRRAHLLATVNRARQVDLHQVAVSLLRRPRGALVGIGGQVAAGIGHQDIDSAEFGHGGFHHRDHRLAVRNVRFDGERAPSQGLHLFRHGSGGQLFSEFRRRVQPDVVDDDIGSQPGQVQDISASQASGPTCHQGDFAPKFRPIHRSTAFVPPSVHAATGRSAAWKQAVPSDIPLLENAGNQKERRTARKRAAPWKNRFRNPDLASFKPPRPVPAGTGSGTDAGACSMPSPLSAARAPA